MTQKMDILDELGEATLSLPAQLSGALAANDRVEYLTTTADGA